jgi:hypothetical protein
MKKAAVVLLIVVSSGTRGVHALEAYSMGLILGPYNNERPMLESDGEYDLASYKFPLFLGGIYHKLHFDYYSGFFYSDLALNIHKAEVNSLEMTSYLLYFHNEFNFYVIDRIAYFGAGLELAAAFRNFSEEYKGERNHLTPYYFIYFDAGVNLPLGIVEMGFKILYRVAPDITRVMGNGELCFLIGLNSFRNEAKPEP